MGYVLERYKFMSTALFAVFIFSMLLFQDILFYLNGDTRFSIDMYTILFYSLGVPAFTAYFHFIKWLEYRKLEKAKQAKNICGSGMVVK